MRGRLALCAAASLALTLFSSSGPASAKDFGLYGVHFQGFSRHGLYRAHYPHHHHHGRDHHGRHSAYGYVFLPSVEDDLGPLYAGPACQKTEETVIVPSEGGGERTVRIMRC